MKDDTPKKPGDEGILETARQRFKVAVDATSENRILQLDDIKFAAASPDNGWQWPEEVLRIRQKDPNGARPTLTINKLPQHIRLVTNEQRQNRPSVKVLPVDDQGDPEVAEVFTGIVRHIEVSSNADVAYDTACECQVTSGEGYFRVLTEYCDDKSFEQDILIAPLKNQFSVYLDPVGLRYDATGAKCEWGFISDELDKDEYQRQFPDAKGQEDWEQSGIADDDKLWFVDKKVRIVEYFYAEYKKETAYLWSNGEVTLDENPPVDEFMTPATLVKDRETQIRTIKWCKTNGMEILEKQDWAGQYIPIIRVVGNEYEVEGKMWVSGIVRNAKDAMRMVNYWVSQEAEMLALAPKAPFVGAAGQFENHEEKWQQANTTNFAYLEYNPIDVNQKLVPPPQRQAPVMPQAGIMVAKQEADANLQATVGQYNPSLGAEAQEKSGVAIRARQQQADVGTYHYIDNLSRGIRYLGVILVDLAPKIYDTARVVRILGEDGEPDQRKLDPNQQMAVNKQEDEMGEIEKIYNPNVGRYDVVVAVGPSYTTKRMEAADGMAQVIQANPELWGVVGDLFVKNMDWPGADEIATRIKKTIPPELTEDVDEDEEDMIETPVGQLPVSQAGQAIESLTQQIQQSGDQMQQMQQELQRADMLGKENDARKIEVERFKAETDRMVGEAETAAVVDKQRIEKMELDIKDMLAESTVDLNEAKIAEMINNAIQSNNETQTER